jgi:hypothetical protein
MLWYQTTDEVKFLGLLAGLSMIWYWMCFLMSDSFLSQHAVAGIIFGAAWRQTKPLKADKKILSRRLYWLKPINRSQHAAEDN